MEDKHTLTHIHTHIQAQAHLTCPHTHTHRHTHTTQTGMQARRHIAGKVNKHYFCILKSFDVISDAYSIVQKCYVLYYSLFCYMYVYIYIFIFICIFFYSILFYSIPFCLMVLRCIPFHPVVADILPGCWMLLGATEGAVGLRGGCLCHWCYIDVRTASSGPQPPAGPPGGNTSLGCCSLCTPHLIVSLSVFSPSLSLYVVVF